MRSPLFLLAIAAVALAGCDLAVRHSVDKAASKFAAAPGEGWTMQVLGESDDHIFLVTGPDGARAAARLKDGVSSLMDDAEAQGMVDRGREDLASAGPESQKVAIAAPGISLKVSGDDTDGSGGAGHGHVQIKVAGVNVDVNGSDDNSADGHGQVRIAGVNRDTAAKFIDDIHELSPDVKKQMRAKLGL